MSLFKSGVHRRRKPTIGAHPQNPRATPFRHKNRIIGGPVIAHNNFIKRPSLPPQILQQRKQQIAPIPVRNHRRDLHEKRFFTRNHRF